MMFGPKLANLKVLGCFSIGKTMTCNDCPVECDLCFKPAKYLEIHVPLNSPGKVKTGLKICSVLKISSRSAIPDDQKVYQEI